MNLLLRVKQKVQQLATSADLSREHPLIILGLSGGADSVFLFHVLLTMQKNKQLDFICAHFNHGWRKDATLDEQFCRELTSTHRVKIVVKNPQSLTKSFKFNGSKEELGRKMRREFFDQVKKEHSGTHIALAHHQQDQIETFFIRLARGCSLEGLSGIKPIAGNYIRPLLNINKAEILDFLKANNIPWTEDETNKSPNFLRNRIRHQLLPLMQQIDSRFTQKITDSIGHLQQENLAMESIANQAFDHLFQLQNNSYVGSREKLLQLQPAILHRVIIIWFKKESVPFTPSLGIIKETLRFIRLDTDRTHKLHQHWQITKKTGCIRIKKLTP
jgi:tRNA(Ile)-lysidine synthase